jgi:regulator of protease activity HflC (stomatin/prohibitin superfamily)
MAIGSIFTVIVVLVIVFSALGSFVTVQQGNVAIVTFFGKYRRIMFPGLNFKLPWVETIFRMISIQNRSVELQFQAITVDQANVYFKSMLLYSVLNQDENTLKNVAFK